MQDPGLLVQNRGNENDIVTVSKSQAPGKTRFKDDQT
jgi:hypothetical protein